MATQIGVTRVYSDVNEDTNPDKIQCPNCKVYAVPRGINSTKVSAPGEKHCPNCGHIHGRANH